MFFFLYKSRHHAQMGIDIYRINIKLSQKLTIDFKFFENHLLAHYGMYTESMCLKTTNTKYY